jgi:putative nucleotidyltransferase with HDIG domain
MIRGTLRARLAPVDAPRRLAALLARTARAFVPALARPDDPFAAAWLTAGEWRLYRAMDARDRDHGCRVARRLLRDHPDAEPVWVRAALLHDVGKSLVPYRAWERIAVHLVRRTAPPTPPRRGAGGPLRRAVARDHAHAEVGARMLAEVGADPQVVALVAGHHRPRPDDPAAVALAAADAAADAGWRTSGASARERAEPT